MQQKQNNMGCPYCHNDLSEFWGDYDAIYNWHTCPACDSQIWLDYVEYYNDETDEEWGDFRFLTQEKF